MNGSPHGPNPALAPATPRSPGWARLLRRRWWVLALSTGLALGAVAVHVQRQPVGHFVSSARMVLTGRSHPPEGKPLSDATRDFLGTQIELLKSPAIAERARARLQRLRPELPVIPDPALVVARHKRTDIVVLTARGSDPETTRAFLDAVMEECLEFRNELRWREADSSRAALSAQLAAWQKDLDGAAEQVRAFEREHDLALLREQIAGVPARLAGLDAERARLRAESDQSAAAPPDQQVDRLLETPADAPQPRPDASPVSASTLAAYRKAAGQLQARKAEREADSRFFRPAHPRMVRHDDEIQALEKSVAFHRQQARDEFDRYREALALRLRNLEQTIAQTKGLLREASRRMAEHERLKTELERAQNRYDQLLIQVQMQSALPGRDPEPETLSILERASVARPVRRFPVWFLASGAAAGLLAGLGILWVVGRFENRTAALAELLNAVNEMTLARIPELDVLRLKRLELARATDLPPALARASRQIASSLRSMATAGRQPSVIVVSSAAPGDGGSTVAASLALAVAGTGRRVLLVDADLPRGAQQDIFKLNAGPGTSEVLRGQINPAQALVATPFPGLFLIPCGATARPAVDPLPGPRLDAFLNDMAAQFDLVLVDAPLAAVVGDGIGAVSEGGALLLVVRAAPKSARLARTALERLQRRRVKVLGLILNRVSPSAPEHPPASAGAHPRALS